MRNPFIFVSCGQYTPAEKSLGKAIVQQVKNTTGLDAFFAEDVQDLNGLDSNILAALRDAVAFITVLHPRGTITRPNRTVHVRASVWIEQEIAIATYIQRVEKRSLPVIAFIHESVGREGIRDLLQLNPIPFKEESEVLAKLPALLQRWKRLSPTGIHVQLRSVDVGMREDRHMIRQLIVSLVNESNQRITNLNCRVTLPTGILKHWSTIYAGEDKSTDPRHRVFRIDEKANGPVAPHATGHLMTLEYCMQCAIIDTRESPHIGGTLVSEYAVSATVWIDGREHTASKTLKELLQEKNRETMDAAAEALAGP